MGAGVRMLFDFKIHFSGPFKESLPAPLFTINSLEISNVLPGSRPTDALMEGSVFLVA